MLEQSLTLLTSADTDMSPLDSARVGSSKLRLPMPLAGVVLLSLISFLGCGQTKYDMVPIVGVVTLDGKPLEGAAVKFQPQGGGAMSFGTTDAAGNYALQTMDGEPGAMIATHTVSVYKTSGTVDVANDDAPSKIQQLIPERYNLKSELVYEVKAGDSKSADFALSTK